MTLHLFDSHLVSRKPPLFKSCDSSLDRWIASPSESTDFKQSSTWKFCSTVLTALLLKSAQLSAAVFFKAKLAQLGEDTAPNRCMVIMYSSGSRSRFPLGHQRKRNVLWSSGFTRTWWNIASTSDINATGSWWNLVNTPTREFVRSGPCKSSSSRDLPWYLAEQSNTTRTFPGFAGCWTA